MNNHKKITTKGNKAKLSPDKRSVDRIKKRFLEIFRENKGMVYVSLNQSGLSKTNYYEMLKEDEEFYLAVNSIKEEVTDFVESKLLENIEKNKEISTIFYLKCKARDRGYIEIQDVKGEVTQKQLSINVLDIETRELMEQTIKLLGIPKDNDKVEIKHITPNIEHNQSI